MNKNEIWINNRTSLQVKIFKLDKRNAWVCNAKGKWQFKVAVSLGEFEKNYTRKK